MSLRTEIIPYTDGNGLVAPNLVGPGIIRSSDNGIMFTSEYYIMLKRNGEATHQDLMDYVDKLTSCTQLPGLVCRAPKDTGQEGPDDYLGVLAGCTEYGIESEPREIYSRLKSHFGFLNNINPSNCYQGDGKSINWEAFLVRQLQLVAAMLSAGSIKRWYYAPIFFYTALVILYTGLMNYPTDDGDARRLCWLLIQAVEPKSFMCRLASRVWYWKLYKDYPGDANGNFRGMKGVAARYYKDNHPFTKYWVDKRS